MRNCRLFSKFPNLVVLWKGCHVGNIFFPSISFLFFFSSPPHPFFKKLIFNLVNMKKIVLNFSGGDILFITVCDKVIWAVLDIFSLSDIAMFMPKDLV